LKNSFPSALLAVVQTPDDFAETLLRVLAAGGDNAGRAAIAGAILGAHLGCRAIPDSLRQQLVAKDRIAKAVAMILETMSSWKVPVE
jgi:ADP-ribosylglycohydrolase